MEELKKAIADGKKAIHRIRWDLEKLDLDLCMPDWEDIIESLVFLKGYIACLETTRQKV